AEGVEAQQVPVEWLKDAASKSFDPAGPSVKMMTRQSSKGLQVRVTIIGGVGFWPWQAEEEQGRLLYVAMTRATHELVLTSSRGSRFSERLKGLCATAA